MYSPEIIFLAGLLSIFSSPGITILIIGFLLAVVGMYTKNRIFSLCFIFFCFFLFASNLSDAAFIVFPETEISLFLQDMGSRVELLLHNAGLIAIPLLLGFLGLRFSTRKIGHPDII